METTTELQLRIFLFGINLVLYAAIGYMLAALILGPILQVVF